jgi:hypothetical protein
MAHGNDQGLQSLRPVSVHAWLRVGLLLFQIFFPFLLPCVLKQPPHTTTNTAAIGTPTTVIANATTADHRYHHRHKSP